VAPTLTDDEIEEELKQHELEFKKCLRIRNNDGPTYMVRVLTDSQNTIDFLLEQGAYIYHERFRVEPSRTKSPLPYRCEECQQYNSHTTTNCPNTAK